MRMVDRKILSNMDPDAVWARMHPCVQQIIGAYASGDQMMERFGDVIMHARRLIQDTCGQCGVAPHNCVCAVYCFMVKSGYYTLPKLQVMLAALIKGEMEIMAEEFAKTQRQAEKKVVVFHPIVPAARVVTAHGQSVVVNNHHGMDEKRLSNLELKLEELLRLMNGQSGAPNGAPSAPEPTDWIMKALREIQSRS